jgi:hypothetical protein
MAPTFAYHQHALGAAAATLAEARGRLADAAAGYARCAAGFRQLGVVPEVGHALLGQGRCLLALGRPGAAEPLAAAARLFAGLRAAPLLAEAERLAALASPPGG